MASGKALDSRVAAALRAAIAQHGIDTVAEKTGVHQQTLLRGAAGLGVFNGTAKLIALAVAPSPASR